MDAFASADGAAGSEAGANANKMLDAYTPAKDDAALWLGAACDESGGRAEDEAYLASLCSGGALMGAGGGWSISTFPGEEGLRWSGVKTEQLFDEWASGGGGKQQATASELVMRSSPLLATAAAATATADKGKSAGTSSSSSSSSSSGAKQKECWKDLIGPPRTKLPSADGYSPSSFPPSSSSHKKARAPVASEGLIKLPAALPTTSTATHSADSSTKDNIAAFAQQRSSSRATAPKTPTAVKPAAAARTVPPRAMATAPPAPAATKTRAAAAAAAVAAAAAAAPPAPPAPSSATTAVTTRTRRSAAAAAAAAAAPATVKAELAQDEHSGDEDDDYDDYIAGGRKKTRAKKTRRASIDSGDDADSDDAVGSELTDKRRRNREHAKRSRLRKRVRLGGLEEMVLGLRRENVRLRQMVMSGIPDRADVIIRTCAKDNTNADVVSKQDVVQGMRPGMSVGSSSSSWSARGGTRKRPKTEGGSGGGGGGGGGGSSSGGRKDHRVPSALKLMSPGYQTVKSLVDSQANFILTNPNLPDCPIIFASQGFLGLTGYEGRDVIGKNCRFLQGPGTDPMTLSIVRNNLTAGRDVSVCILNYKKNGTPFWNQLSIGVLLDAHGQVANHVGVMCEVSEMPPAVFHRLLHRVPLPESLLHDDSGSESDGEDDHVERSRVSAGSLRRPDGAKCGAISDSGSRVSSVDGEGEGDGSTARSSTGPRVVDRMRRTRAAAAAIDK